MLTYNRLFAEELRRLISETVEEKKEHLLNSGDGEFSNFRHQIGVIAGLRMALDLCDEAISIVQKRERGA